MVVVQFPAFSLPGARDVRPTQFQSWAYSGMFRHRGDDSCQKLRFQGVPQIGNCDEDSLFCGIEYGLAQKA